MKRIVWSGLGSIGIMFAGCSIENQASDVICVRDQSDICTDCARPPGDNRSYRGRHTCAADGKSFGPCLECAPITDELKAPSPFEPLPTVNSGPTEGSSTPVDPACNDKLTVIAGHDDPNDAFIYVAVVKNGRFSVLASSGAPMRSEASFVVSEDSMTSVYRSKASALVTSTFKAGLWSTPSAIPNALTDASPTIASWGKQNKVVFHTTDGRYSAVDWDPTTGWGTSVVIGDVALAAQQGTSAPAGATVGAPGVRGSGVMFGYTDSTGGLYRQDWNGTSWRSAGLKSTAVVAAPMRTALVPMNGGAFDLVSSWVASDGHPYIATRSVRDNGSVWSSPILVTESASPLDGVRGVGLPGGRAMLLWRDADKHGWYSVFDPTKTPQFSDPAALLEKATPLASTPSAAVDRCGAEAVIAYAEVDGAVGVLRYSAGALSKPIAIEGLSKMTYAAAASIP